MAAEPPSAPPLIGGWTSQHTAWLLFGPPAFMVGVRWILQLFIDRQNATPALPLIPVGTTTGLLDLLWPVALGLALLAGAVWGLRRIGSRRALIVLGAAWLLIGLAGSAAMVQRYVNREGLWLKSGGVMSAAPPPVVARVVTRQSKMPNLHSLGGTELVLQVPGLAIPQRLLIDDPQAALLKSGDTLALQLTPGRFSGQFVTGWQIATLAEAPRSSTSAASR